MSSNEINELQAEIVRLNEKIKVMRGLLWEWNPTSDNVWEYYRLHQVGETSADYTDWTEDEMDMPLFDQDDDRDFMERL
jgi:hypothetical protein